ncbi:DExH-box splicing factor binding site-domain-containing protein [Syncephalis plumigaleata]|nr:DExH-box splicing factor binding site-domain-containing protein [Syncephalis plumigaleata]
MFGGRRIGQKGAAKISISLGKKSTITTITDSNQGASNSNSNSNNNDNTITSSDNSQRVDTTTTTTNTSSQNATKKIELNLNLLRDRKSTLAATSIFTSVDTSKKRRRRYQRGSDDEDEDDNILEEKDKVIALTGFADNEALQLHPAEEPEGPLVIKPIANRDWRADRKRRLLGMTTADTTDTSDTADTSRDTTPVQGAVERTVQDTSFGLQLMKSKKTTIKKEIKEQQVSITTSTPVVIPTMNDTPTTTVELSSEEQAIKALYAEAQRLANGDSEGEEEEEAKRNKPKLVLGVSESTSSSNMMNNMNNEGRQRLEADAFKEEYNNCPDPSTLDDYEDVPVEEFGAALLRGMGWKDGQGIGRGHRESDPTVSGSEQRPRLLGLGAKPLPMDLQETTKKPKRPRLPLPALINCSS